MREGPILFTTDMVGAILEDRKTHTRRVIKSEPCECGNIFIDNYQPVAIDRHGEEYPGKEIYGAYCGCGEWGIKSPYRKPGDRLWVREKFRQRKDDGVILYSDGNIGFDKSSIAYKMGIKNVPAGEFDEQKMRWAGFPCKWKPSIYMPRWASRITLEIKDIRVERVQDITEEDAKAEGVHNCFSDMNVVSFKDIFHNLWDSINKKRGYGWDLNPWVWVVEFKRITP